MTFNFRFYPHGVSKGNSIVEYCLIGAFVIISAIAATLALGQNVNANFGGVQMDMASQSSSAEKAERLSKAAISSMDAMKALEDAEATSTPSGTPSYSNFGNSSFGSAFTAGANGNSGWSFWGGSSRTSRTSAPPPETPVVTQDQKTLILQLANYGHKIGAMQQTLIDLGKYTADDANKLKTAKLVVQGQEMDAYDYANSLVNGSELASFTKKTNEVMASDASPEVKAYIKELSDKVVAETEALNNNIIDVMFVNGDPKALEKDEKVAEGTHKSSASICSQAKGTQDDGAQCTSTEQGAAGKAEAKS